MDPEPVPRILLVTGVTYMTVGLVTLAIGIVFLVVELHGTALLLAVWPVAVVSGACAVLTGGLLSSLACNERSRRPPTLTCLVVFTATGGLALGSQVALVVLSAFHVTRNERWREIHIFFISASGIQFVALVVAVLVLIKITCECPDFFKATHRRQSEPQDNYGFLGDGDTWQNSAKMPRSPGLVRWPGVEHLESRGSSLSSAGGHYIAGDHHPKYIGPSSGDSDDESVASQRISNHKVQSTSMTDSTIKEVQRETDSVGNHSSHSRKSTPIDKRVPQRPPRKCDSFNMGSQRRSHRPPIPTPRSIGSPTLGPNYKSLSGSSAKQLFLYDPIEVEVPSVQHERELSQCSILLEQQQIGLPPPRDNLILSANHLANGGPTPSKMWNGDYVNDPNTYPIYTYDHSIPRSKQRPRHPPPPVPHNGHRKTFVYTVENWDGKSEPSRDSTLVKPPRKVTFLEAQV